MSRPITRAVVLTSLLVAPGLVVLAQEKPPAETRESSRERVLGVARKIMTAARFCTLITIGELGQPQARIVDPLEPDGAFAIYLATNPRSRKVGEIRKDPRVTLMYFDPARSAYVTLIGAASELPNLEKAAHRKPDWEAFFPAGKPETYTVYRIVPSRMEVVSARDGLNGDPATWRPEIIEFK